MIADILRVGQLKAGRLDRLQRKVDSCDLILGTAQWPENQHLLVRIWQDNPLPAACLYQRPDGEAHVCPPKTQGYFSMTASQPSRSVSNRITL